MSLTIDEKSSHPELILQFVFLKLWEMSLIHYFISRILIKTYWNIFFSNLAALLLWLHLEILFEIFGTFGRHFLHAALIGCFFKEIGFISINIKAVRLSSQDEKVYCLGYVGTSPLASGIPPIPKQKEKHPGFI